MDIGNKSRKYGSVLLNIALGASAVVGGAYVVSRITEKQESESRLDRLEQMLKEVKEEK